MAEETRIEKHSIKIDPKQLKLLDLNAHFMSQEKYARMVANIQRDGCLTGNTPFGRLLYDDTTRHPVEPAIYEVLSGNHRVKACIDAGLPEIDIEVTDVYLPPARRKAIQIAHNALVGEDDPAVLKLIYDEIDDVALRAYSGLDDKMLALLEDVSVAPISEAQLEFQNITLTFLPDEAERAGDILDVARKTAAKSAATWLMRWREYDRAMDALEAAGSAHGIKNAATALLLILELFDRNIDQLADGYLDAERQPIDPRRHVPTVSTLGYTIPASLAAQILRLGDNPAAALEVILSERLEAERK